MTNQPRLSRRMFLGGSIGVAGLASNVQALSASPQIAYASSAISNSDSAHASSLQFMSGQVDPNVNGFDPSKMLTDFDYGKVSKLPNGQTLRDYTITSADKTIFPAPGKQFSAWAYNGRVPGPTLRATAGDHIRIHYINKSKMTHGIHFHGIHAGNVDAGFVSIIPGSETFYEFDAQPFGMHLYHCHMSPLATHMVKGLYGFFIVDPPPSQSRPKALELAMMMNSFTFSKQISFGSTNDLYAINTVAYHFLKQPIPVPVNQLVRVYLGSMVEFDQYAGFQMHSNMFNLFPTGTSLQPSEVTDSIALCQGQRAILEFTFKSPGQYIFRSPYAVGTDKGLLGAFEAG